MIFNSSRRHKGLKRALRASTVAALIGLSGTAAQAGGFYIQEQSASGLGSAFAGVTAIPRDASTLFYNGAGMTELSGTHVNAGAHILFADASMKDKGSTLFGPAIGGDNGGNPFDPALVPNAYITHQLTDKVWLGLGVSAPFGLKLEYDNNFFGRYDSLKNELTIIDVQPTMAYKVNDWLSAAVAINYQYADAKLTSAVSDGTEGRGILEGGRCCLRLHIVHAVKANQANTRWCKLPLRC